MLELSRVRDDLPRIGIEIGLEDDFRAEQAPDHLLARAHNGVDLERSPLGPARATVVKQQPGECNATIRCIDDFLHVATLWLAQLLQEEFAVTSNDQKEILEVVGDAADEASQGFHPLRLPELLLDAALLGDIPQRRDPAWAASIT